MSADTCARCGDPDHSTEWHDAATVGVATGNEEPAPSFAPDYFLADLGDSHTKAVQPGTDLPALDAEPEYLDEDTATQEDFDLAWAEAVEVNPNLDAEPTDYGKLGAE